MAHFRRVRPQIRRLHQNDILTPADKMSDNANMHCYFFTLNLFFQLIQIYFKISYLITIYKSASRCSGRLLF